jgi:hypothetical protein
MILFLSFPFLESSDLIPGVPPFLEMQYRSAINTEASTFTCFDQSRTIPLIHFNDNYHDCPDFSDEPSTSDGPSTSFYCHNNGSIPREIPRWSVGDGICDCCDGSDELFASLVTCPMTCPNTEKDRQKVLSRLLGVYKSGLRKRESMLRAGEEYLSKHRRAHGKLLGQIAVLEAKISVLEARPIVRSGKRSPPPTSDENGTEVGISENVTVSSSALRRGILRIWEWTFAVGDAQNPYLREPILESEQKKRLRNLQKKLRHLKKEAEDGEKVETSVTKGMPVEFLPFVQEPFKNGDFKIVLGKEWKKKYEDLGKFARYEDDTMFYEHGRYCWSTKTNHASELKVVCGKRNRLVKVSDAGDCRHKGVFSTPAVCSADRMEALKKMGLPDLQEIASAL